MRPFPGAEPGARRSRPPPFLLWGTLAIVLLLIPIVSADAHHSVDPMDADVPVAGGPPPYLVTFMESGLASGSRWSVTLDGTSLNTTGTSLQFDETNGTYSYSAESTSVSPASWLNGTVVVAGANQEVALDFRTSPPPSQGGSASPTFGLLSSGAWIIGVAVVAVLFLFGVSLGYARRASVRSRPLEPLPPEPAPPLAAPAPGAAQAPPNLEGPATEGDDPLSHML